MQVNRIRLSHSTLSLLHSCPRKFELTKMYQQPEEASEEYHASEVGHAMHKAIQNYMLHKDKHQAIITLMLNYPIHLELYNKDVGRTYSACLSTLYTAIDTIEANKLELVFINDKPAIELPFDIYINETYHYVGLIDLICKSKITGEIFAIDIKTSRMGLEPKGYSFDDQVAIYQLVLLSLLKQDTSKLKIRYLLCHISVAYPEAIMVEIDREEDALQKLVAKLKKDILDIEYYKEHGFFPQRSSHCVFYNKVCRFHSICNNKDKDNLQKLLLGGKTPVIKTFKSDINLKLEVFNE